MTDIIVPADINADADDTFTLRIYRERNGTWAGSLIGSNGLELGDLGGGCFTPQAVEQAARDSGIHPTHVELEAD